jgi:hypothetical protein
LRGCFIVVRAASSVWLFQVVAMDLSRTVFRRIQLNMLFSLLFNVLGIPIAAGVIYPWAQTRLPPELAALAMALSSVSVVTSSLLLRRYVPPHIPIDSGPQPSGRFESVAADQQPGSFAAAAKQRASTGNHMELASLSDV